MADRAAQRTTFSNITILGGTTVIAVVTLTAVVAVFNGLLSGGPIFQTFLEFWGFGIPGVIDGPGRMLLVIGVLVVLSMGIEIAGVETTAPFWIGLGIIGMLLAEFVFPGWLTGPFGSLGLGEFFFGMPLRELDPVRTAILGVAFIVVYYMVYLRIEGARETTSYGAQSFSHLLFLTRQRLQRLLRQYAEVLGAIAAFAGMAIVISGQGVLDAFIEFANPLVNYVASAPVWGGYVSTLGSYLGAFIFGIFPFDVSHRLFAVLASAVFLIVVANYIRNN